MNSDFKLFELSETKYTISTNECKHENVIIDCHKKVCEDCGSDLDEIVSFKKEWRYYGNNDSKLMSDPNRCQIRKNLPEKKMKSTMKIPKLNLKKVQYI